MVSGKKSRGPYTTNPNSLSNLPLIFDTNNDANPNPSLISFEIHALTPASYAKQYNCSCSPNINKRKEKMGGGERKVYTLAQISEHNSRKDCWLVIEGRVCMYVIFMFTHSSWLLGSLLFLSRIWISGRFCIWIWSYNFSYYYYYYLCLIMISTSALYGWDLKLT